MRNPKGSGRKPGRRRQCGDDGPDLFAAKLSEAVKQAFEGGGGFVETQAAAPAETAVLPTEPDPIEPDINPSTEDMEGAAPSLPPDPPMPAFPDSPPQSSEGAAPSLRADAPISPFPDSPSQPSPVFGLRSPVSPTDTDPLPARMLNEFVYCPRLFYYEYVEGVFVENADTMRGAAVHARVDKGSGAMPPSDSAPAAKRKRRSDSDTADKPVGEPDTDAAAKSALEGPEIIHSRSATLGSDRLGVIAKLDLVEFRLAASESGTEIPPAEVDATGNGGMGEAGTRRGTGFLPAKQDDWHEKDSGVTHGARSDAIHHVNLGDSHRPDASANSAETESDHPPSTIHNSSPSSSGLELPGYEVCPVDYKAGAPREGEEGNELWPADRMQLGLQILILRENGYRCDRGIIYYRATKQRVPLDWTTELEAWVISQIEAAHRTMKGAIPPPLIGSPKCVRCSLNSVCLPDETRLLADAAHAQKRDVSATSTATAAAVLIDHSPSAIPPPRRLIAVRDDKRVLYLNKPGTRVGRKDELITVKEENRTLEEVRIGDLTHVSLFGNIQISTQAIQVLCDLEVPITFFSMGGWFYGITRGHGLKNVFTRIEQFRLAADPVFCLALARRIVNGKIRNHRTMVMRLHLQPPAPIVAKLKTMAESALQAKTLEALLGTEGAAAHFYFSAFSGMLKVEDDFADIESPKAPQLCFNFAGRNRRPPTDPVNALLSLAYSLLAKDCTLAAMAVGLDPYIGFYHQPRFGRPALALDIMEEFRPLIAESVVLTCINNRMILPRHFVRAGQAVNLSQEGRKLFFQAYERRMGATIKHPIFEYEVSYRRVLELQFRLLARYLTGEISEYPPFVTR